MTLAITLLAAGCTSSPTEAVPRGTFEFQTLAPGPIGTCAGVSLADVTFHGDRAAGKIWAEAGDNNATRWPTTWPNGYTARFNPDLQILSGSGELVASGGVEYDVGVCTIADGRIVVTDIDGVALPR